ncbi:MAG TPA: hypothetical protein VFN43_00600 [Humibacillus sp.]|nr:hypothetical protein [Humibacillus sp.]
MLTVLLALAVSAACTVQVGGGGKPSPLVDYVGANGLLADPAATAHRPSLDVTLNRLWAARVVGVAATRTPSPSMVAVALTDATGLEHEDLRLRWATMQADVKTARAAIAELNALCGPRAASTDPDCEGTLASAWAFLTATRAPALATFHQTFPAVRAPACPTSATSLSDLYRLALCNGPTVDEGTFERALSDVPRADGLVRDSRVLFVAAVVDETFGLGSEALRILIQDALDQSQVEGVYFDEVPAQGTVLTSWALLHLAGSDRAGIDASSLATAIRQEPTDGAADRIMLVRAALSVLGETDRPKRAGALVLRDPDGPYNPFIALAARDGGDLGLVSLGFTAERARTSPERFASYVITRRILGGKPVALSAADVALLRRLSTATEDSPVVPRMLMETALAAGGQPLPPGAPGAAALGCGDAAWLVTVSGTCDLRASLLLDLFHEFTTTTTTSQGTS